MIIDKAQYIHDYIFSNNIIDYDTILQLFNNKMPLLHNNFANFWPVVNSLPIGCIIMPSCSNKSGTVIGITGQKFTGKDTITHYLKHKYNMSQLAFSDSLKNVCGALFGFSYEQLHGKLKETPDNRIFGLTPRVIMQYVGTDIFREYDPNFWISCTLCHLDNNSCIISDIRFQNEYDMIRSKNGHIIRITRMLSNISIVDYEITNDCDLTSLYEKADEIMKKIEFTNSYLNYIV